MTAPDGAQLASAMDGGNDISDTTVASQVLVTAGAGSKSMTAEFRATGSYDEFIQVFNGSTEVSENLYTAPVVTFPDWPRWIVHEIRNGVTEQRVYFDSLAAVIVDGVPLGTGDRIRIVPSGANVTPISLFSRHRTEVAQIDSFSFAVPFTDNTRGETYFEDDLEGAAGENIIGTSPSMGGGPWAEEGLQSGQFQFAAGGGVQDAGPNSSSSNALVGSVLATPLSLSRIPSAFVAHLHVRMANISATPASNPFQSSRVDLITDTSGIIFLGEAGTGGNWGATSQFGSPFASNITTAQSGQTTLDLYLDPHDALGDGPTFNAALSVNGGQLIRGTIPGLSTATSISEVRLVRNVDDEVWFDDVRVDAVQGRVVGKNLVFQASLFGPPGVDLISTWPEIGGEPWAGSGLQPQDQIHFGPNGGVVDEGPNSRFSNTSANSTLLQPFSLSALRPEDLMHLQVIMANTAADPASNKFESSRVDLVTSSNGIYHLGEFDTAGNWGAEADTGNAINSGLSTGQSGLVTMDLFLDPNDVLQDGPASNVALSVNHGPLQMGYFPGLSSSTTLTELRLIRNVDDEVLFGGLVLEATPLSIATTSVGDLSHKELGFLSARPNPFASNTGIQLSLAEKTNVAVAVYDVAGRLVRTLQSGVFQPGMHDIPWDGRDRNGLTVQTGIYFIRARVGSHDLRSKVVRVK